MKHGISSFCQPSFANLQCLISIKVRCSASVMQTSLSQHLQDASQSSFRRGFVKIVHLGRQANITKTRHPKHAIHIQARVLSSTCELTLVADEAITAFTAAFCSLRRAFAQHSQTKIAE